MRRSELRHRPSHLALAHGCWGALLLVAPASLLERVSRSPVDGTVTGVVRVLGARHLVQGVATGRRPSRRRLKLGALVDFTHATSMLALAVVDAGPRALTLASAGMTTALAATAVADSRR